MGERAEGRLVSYNDSKQYGFLKPDGGGDDVFVHAREVGYPLTEADIGGRFSYEAVPGQRGDKGIDLRPLIAGPSENPRLGEDEWESATHEEYIREITDVLIESAPDLTGKQIARIRQQLVARAEARNWLDS